MQIATKLLIPVALAVLVFSLSGCDHSTSENRRQNQEHERQQVLAEKTQVLTTFASQHNATPIQLSELLDNVFTAQLQGELEGKVVAFRADLIDVVRVSDDDYQLVLADSLLFNALGGIVVRLMYDNQDIANFHTSYSLDNWAANYLETYLVVAKIEKVTPITFTIAPCTQPDCETVHVEVPYFAKRYILVGDAIAISPENSNGQGKK